MRSGDPHSTLTAMVAFIVTALIASVLLVSAFVLFLGEIIGSHLLSMVIVGGVCAVVSWAVYSSSLRPLVRALEEQLTTIYEVAYSAQRAYDWVKERLRMMVNG